MDSTPLLPVEWTDPRRQQKGTPRTCASNRMRMVLPSTTSSMEVLVTLQRPYLLPRSLLPTAKTQSCMNLNHHLHIRLLRILSIHLRTTK